MPSNKNLIITEIIRNRVYQLLINEKIGCGEFKIPVHLALGHEAIATAIRQASNEADAIFCTHRNLHFNIAFNANFSDEYYELKLSPKSKSKGALGSMNLSHPDGVIKYSSSILGNNLGAACGYALGNHATNSGGIVFAVTGDGAIEEGIFYEALLFAASQKLKIIFIVENNKWSLATEIKQRRSAINLEALSKSFDIGYKVFNDNNVFEYIKNINKIKEDVFLKSNPCILEVNLTTLGYRHTETGRCINYHAGNAGNVVFDVDNIVLSDIAEEDPLNVLKKYISEKEFNDAVSLAMQQILKVQDEVS